MRNLVDIAPCLCGHIKKAHIKKFDYFLCVGCFYAPKTKKERQHPFKLDNLSYVEVVAKEKKLI